MLEVKVTDAGLVCVKCGSEGISGRTVDVQSWETKVELIDGILAVIFYNDEEPEEQSPYCRCKDCGTEMSIPAYIEYD